MAAFATDWSFLVLGPCPDSDLYLLQNISSPLQFPSAPETQLVLGSPGHGECSNSFWLLYLGVNGPGMELGEIGKRELTVLVKGLSYAATVYIVHQ